MSLEILQYWTVVKQAIAMPNQQQHADERARIEIHMIWLSRYRARFTIDLIQIVLYLIE